MSYFDGTTYEADKDHDRLDSQLKRVQQFMGDRRWHTLSEIVEYVSPATEASVSARLRDLRKTRFGGHTVERERHDSGLFFYRLKSDSH